MNWKFFFKKYWLMLAAALIWVLDGVIWVLSGLQSGEWLDWAIAMCAFAIATTYMILPLRHIWKKRK